MNKADLDLSVEMQKTGDAHIQNAHRMTERDEPCEIEILYAIERRASAVAYLFHKMVEEHLEMHGEDDNQEEEETHVSV